MDTSQDPWLEKYGQREGPGRCDNLIRVGNGLLSNKGRWQWPARLFQEELSTLEELKSKLETLMSQNPGHFCKIDGLLDERKHYLGVVLAMKSANAEAATENYWAVSGKLIHYGSPSGWGRPLPGEEILITADPERSAEIMLLKALCQDKEAQKQLQTYSPTLSGLSPVNVISILGEETKKYWKTRERVRDALGLEAWKTS